MLKYLAIASVLGAFLLRGPDLSKKQESAPHTAHNVPHANAQPAQPAIPIVYGTDCCKTESPKSQNASQEKLLPWPLRPEWVIVYVTIGYAIIAWFTLRSISRQADYMERQGADFRESNAATALAAQETLSAIKRQADSMDTQTGHLASQIAEMQAQTAVAKTSAENALLNAKALINSERAWIMIETIWPHSIDQTVEKQMAMGKRFFAIIEFQNYGNTPAWITQSCAFLKLWNDEMFKNPLDYGNPPPHPNQYPLSPGGTERNKLSIRVEWEGGGFGNFAELRKMKEEGSYPILYGFVKYRDPFPNTIRERDPGISFCYRYDLQSNGWIPWGPSGANEST